LCNVLGNSDQKISKKKNAFQYILSQLRNNESINLYDGGKFYRDYLHVNDVIDAIELVINNGNLNEIYNVGSGNGIEFIEMVDIAKQILKSQSQYINILPTEFHKTVQTKHMVLDINKLKSLGFTPKFDTPQKIIENLI
jgi:nucleoside-diphosphate-sugar epimerase